MSEPLPSLIFSQSAANKAYELMSGEGNLDLNLRVFITGGGCSGFKYGFTFDETVNNDDTIIEKKLDEAQSDSALVKLLIDPASFQYLAGAEIDYREDVEGARFVIKNPNAKTTCGCGSSFSAFDSNEEEE